MLKVKEERLLPQIIDSIFQSISNRISETNNKTFTDSDLVVLHRVYGNVLKKALYLIDNKKVIKKCYKVDKYPSLLIYEIINIKVYKLLPNINYCQCNFVNDNMYNDSSSLICEHILLIKLCTLLDNFIYETININQYNILISSLCDN